MKLKIKSYFSSSEVLQYLEEIKLKKKISVEQTSLKKLNEWDISKKGFLIHQTGRFFSIVGCNVGNLQQPFLLQQDVGILGFLRKKVGSEYLYLFQLKVEPGNINNVQLAPTVQATSSNYQRAHKGGKTKLLELFLNNDENIIFDIKQNEQGYRYIEKYNRNMVVELNEDIDFDDNFIWINKKTVENLLKIDNLINSCARSVLSIEFLKLTKNNKTQYKENKVFNLINEKNNSRMRSEEVRFFSLRKLKNWFFDKDGILKSTTKNQFSILGINVSIPSRENANWSQPILRENDIGEYNLLRFSNLNTTYYLFRQTEEPGIRGFVLAPTQILRSSETLGTIIDNELIKQSKKMISVELSEEGGRFFKSSFRHTIYEISHLEKHIIEKKNLIPLSLPEIASLIENTDLFTMESRSLISLISGLQ